MPGFDKDNREEMDRLWKRTNDLGQEVTELKLQTRLLSDRVEHINNDIHESNGRTVAVLNDVAAKVADLAERLLTMEIVGNTKGRMLDRWLPMVIAGTAVVVSAMNYLDK